MNPYSGYHHEMNFLRLCVIPFIFAMFLSQGCRSTSGHIEKANKDAEGIIKAYQQEALGHTNSFSIERPSDSLRKRLMIEQALPAYDKIISSNEALRAGARSLPAESGAAPTLQAAGVKTNTLINAGSPFRITLLDALQISARNNRSYQSRKEDVFRTALDLDLSRAEFRNSYSGMLSALFSGDGSGTGSRSVEGSSSAGVGHKFQTGAYLTGKIGIDLVKLLTMDKSSTFGLLADATVSIPLLRGAGRDIVREPLTQAEHNIIYAIWGFERYKRSFAVRIAGEYFGALEQAKQIQNAEINVKSLNDARLRMEELARAGRQSETEVNQARQDELRANSRLIAARQRFEEALDALKISLGLPVDARVELDNGELVRLSDNTAGVFGDRALSATNESGKTQEAILTALTNRLDLRTAYWSLEDARRKLNVARDSLDADMKLKLAASTRQTSTSGSTATDVKFGDGKYSALLELDLPWERTAERVAFRKSIILLDAASRQVEEQEDSVKQEIRSAVRRLVELEETYRIQKQAVDLAERRVNSTEIFLQAGRSQIRDLLEAQEALVSAKDALVSATVSYHMASLGLQRDLETLEINEEGLWLDHERK